MVTLASILEEAKRDPSLQNTTVLNDDQFCTIRGPTNPAFRARLEAALAGSGDLNKLQQVNAEEGLEVIQPVQTGIHGGCWDLRNLTHGVRHSQQATVSITRLSKRCWPASSGGKPRHGAGALWFVFTI